LKDQGVLETKPLLAHCIHVDSADLEMLRETQTRVAHCPKSNAKLRHGIAPFGKMLDTGIAVGLGSDSVASNNTCDLLEEARFALLLARSQIESQTEGKHSSADDLLEVTTLGGARALGLEGQTGELKEGLQADFSAVSLNGTHQVPSYQPADTLIFASSARDVVLTVIAGREIYRDGQVTTVDEDRLRARIREIVEKLLK
jgi:5-methylthioadenosine/S-adenosylhomocysteine deaminase